AGRGLLRGAPHPHLLPGRPAAVDRHRRRPWDALRDDCGDPVPSQPARDKRLPGRRHRCQFALARRSDARGSRELNLLGEVQLLEPAVQPEALLAAGDLLSAGVVFVDTGLIVTGWNHWLASASGFEPDAVVGRSLLEI